MDGFGLGLLLDFREQVSPCFRALAKTGFFARDGVNFGRDIISVHPPHGGFLRHAGGGPLAG
jgi:hypothetical protein